jgi:hypothetical protein
LLQKIPAKTQVKQALNENNKGNRTKIERSNQARRSFFSLNSFGK